MISRKINMPKKLKLKQKKFKAHTFDKSNRRKLELTIYTQKRNPYTQTQALGETLNFNSTQPTHQNLGFIPLKISGQKVSSFTGFLHQKKVGT